MICYVRLVIAQLSLHVVVLFRGEGWSGGDLSRCVIRMCKVAIEGHELAINLALQSISSFFSSRLNETCCSASGVGQTAQ